MNQFHSFFRGGQFIFQVVFCHFHNFYLSPVIIETDTCFHTKLAGTNHFAKQRTRAVFVTAEFMLQGFHECKAYIETYIVCKLEWSNWHIRRIH